MKYRNKLTGLVVDIGSKVSLNNDVWEALDSLPLPIEEAEQEKPKRKPRKKKSTKTLQ